MKSSKYILPNMLSYLYNAQDSVSILTGDQAQQDFTSAILSGDIELAREKLISSPDLSISLEYRILHTDDIDTLLSATCAAINVYDVLRADSKSKVMQAIIERVPEIISNIEYFNYCISFENLYNMIRSDNTNKTRKIIDIYFDTRVQIDNHFDRLESIPTTLENLDLLTTETKVNIKKYIEFLRENQVDVPDFSEVTDKISDDMLFEYFGEEYLIYICEKIDSDNNFTEKNVYELKKIIRALIKNEIAINQIAESLYDLFKYPALYKHIDEVLRPMQLTQIEQSIATKIFKLLLRIENSHEDIYISKFLHFLQFKVDNGDFDEYLVNISDSNILLDLISNYLKNNMITFIPKTIEAISENIYTNDDYLKIFEVVEKAYDEDQITSIFTQLKSRVLFKSNKNYDAELKIIKVLLENERNTIHLKILLDDIIASFKSHNSQITYIDFIIKLFRMARSSSINEQLNSMAQAMILSINAESYQTIEFYEEIIDDINDAIYKDLVSALPNHVDGENYDNIFAIFSKKIKLFDDIIIQKNDMVEFLVNKFEFSKTPDIVIRKILSFTEKISTAQIEVMFTKVTNSEISRNNEIVVKFFGKYIFALDDMVASIGIILKLKAINKVLISEVIKSSESDMKKRIVEYIYENHKDYSDGDMLYILDLLFEDFAADQSKLEVLVKYFWTKYDDSITIQYLSTIMSNNKSVWKPRYEYAKIIYDCFVATPSSDVKKIIISTLQVTDLLKQFKSFCTPEELDFVNSNIS